MKRIVALIFLSIISCLVLCSCKSKAATDADNLICSIGDVTLNSEEAIQKAETAIETLNENDYRHLEHLDDLKSARAIYDDLVDQSKAQQIMTAIDQLKDNITLDSKDAISSIRKDYDNANSKVQSFVTNYSDFEQAENLLNTLLVKDVMQKIDAIGMVTLESETAISDAQNAFNNLDNIQQGRVSNIEILKKAKDTLKVLKEKQAERELAEKEAAQKKALSKLRTSSDKVEGITWYKSSNQPRYANSRSYVLPYIGKRDSSSFPWLRLKFHYTGDSWIFWTDLTFSIDGVKKYSKSYNSYDILREVGGGDVWESMDIAPSDADITMLKEIADSKETIIRFQGEHYHYDLTVKASDKAAINDVLTAYEALKSI